MKRRVFDATGSAMTHHPHVHVVVPGGGLSSDGQRWVACRKGFLVSVKVLSRLFRRLLKLADPDAFATYLAPLRKINWVVYAKQPFGGPEAVLAYLSRYTHRIAISNHRLITADADVVAFKWKDYRIKSGDRMKAMRLHTSEFIRRFLIHVLPSGFHRIRHTGFLANGIRRNRIEMIRRLLDVDPVADLKTDDDHCADANEKEQACPKCGGVMIVVETFKRGQTPKSRAPPWEDAA